jgi:hypothetical protein
MLAIETHDTGVVVIRASARLSKTDYDRFVPEFERIAPARGPVRILIELDDFHGWDLPGLWEDLKFDITHQNGIGRVAIVGDRAWQGMEHTALEAVLQSRDAVFRPRQGGGRPRVAD